jgi:hypothetical protein
MDEQAWVQIDMINQLIMLFESSRGSRMMEFDVIVRRPDGICDAAVYHRQVPLLSNDSKDISIFAHQGIVTAMFRPFPEPHFYVIGYLEAIHHCLEAHYLQQVHLRFGEAIRRHAVLAHRTPKPYPAVYDDVRNRRFDPVQPVLQVPPAPRHIRTVFRPIAPAPVTITVSQNRNMDMLQRNLDEVNKS